MSAVTDPTGSNAGSAHSSPEISFLIVNPHVRTVTEDGGAVLLDLFRGRYYSLNPVGAVVWSELESGCNRAELVELLMARYPAERGSVEADVDAVLERLLRMGLVSKIGDAEGERCNPSNVTSERAPTSVSFGRPTDLRGFESGEDGPSGAGLLPGVVWSYLWLISVDLGLRLIGFRRLHNLVRRVRVRQRSQVQTDAVLRRVRYQVDAASRSYIKRAWCLQRSAVMTMRLRWSGVPADLVIGVRRVPFLAHAWVEVGGSVINDDPRVRRFYRVIERC